MVFFISYGKKPKGPKRIWTPEKYERLGRLNAAAEKRGTKIREEFDSLPKIKRINKKIDETLSKSEQMIAQWKSRPDSVDKKKLKLTLSKNATIGLRYLFELRKFAVKNNANHSFLKYLDVGIAEIEEKIVTIREFKF